MMTLIRVVWCET